MGIGSAAGKPARKKRVLSGIQPSGDIHLGNYLGAIKGWVQRQAEKENFFCIVDMHAITVPQDPKDLRDRTRSLAAIYFASGLDPAKCTVFIQSHVTAHAEACWLLNCITPVGWLERMTQFKDKSAKQESVMAGLLDYPVLMAGDILLYSADEVPVGDDQKQHVELTRDIAEKFNRTFGDTFVIPQPVIPEVGARIMGLNDPTAKMSKSFAHIRGHAVRLLDDPKEIEYAFKRAVTDPGNEIRFSDDPAKAGVNNLLGMYKVVTGKTKEQVEADFAGARGYGDLKKAVAEVVINELRPIQERYKQLMSDIAVLDELLAKGAEQASAVAEPKVTEMKERVGFILPRKERQLY
ncbi:MAG: tryptophan--tRNA ligase [SAR202 cluster bacterium]|nr:tryptophan--tRNA ligase [SAR202 cluster bacterium]